MKLHLAREWYTDKSTIGELFVDGQRECFILEDVVRESKVPGKTAIPYGTYQITITQSPRFKRELPLLLDVPGFSGVRIHPGNDADDTEGCLLPGNIRGVNFVGESRKAFDVLFAKLQTAQKAGIPIEITITD